MKNINISDFELEQFLLKELPEERMKVIASMVKEEQSLQYRLKDLEISNEEILEQYPAEFISGQIRYKYNQEKKSDKKSKSANFKFRYVTIPALASLMIISIFLLKTNYDLPVPNDIEITRTKGENASLYIYRKKGKAIEFLSNNSIAREKDLLQVGYSSSKDQYGIIFSIDGNGVITLHFPKNYDDSTKLELKRKVLLLNSYELDDAPRFEKFFLLTSDKELNVETIIDKLKQEKDIIDNINLNGLINDNTINIKKVIILKD